jgi:hypothetical protein
MNMAIRFVDVGLESAIFTYKHAIVLNHYSVEKVQPHVEQPASVFSPFSCRLPDLLPVTRDFVLEFRLHWSEWTFYWVLQICPKVGYE